MKILKNILFSLFLFLLPVQLHSGGVEFQIYDQAFGSGGLEGVDATVIMTSTYQTFTGTTNSAGIVGLNDIPIGSYVYTVEKDGYDLQIGTGTSSGLFTGYNLAMGPWGNTISGTVTNSSTKEGIADATIELFYNNCPIYSSTTNADGSYTTPKILGENQSFEVRYSATSFSSTSVTVDISKSSSVTNVELDVSFGNLSGTITVEGSGTPISDASVVAKTNGSIAGYATTDSSGNYTITGLDIGSYDIIVTAQGYKNILQGAQITSGSTTIFNSTLELEGGSITGTVIDSTTKNPLSNIAVNLQLNGVSMQTATTGTDGAYSFQNLSTDLYILIASGNNHETSVAKAKIVSTTPVTTNFSLGNSPGTVSGKVTNNNSPLAGAKVAIKQNDITIQSYTTQSDGSYSFSGMSPGSYLVYAIETNYQLQSKQVDVVFNTTTTVNFDLVSDAGGVSGTVNDSTSNAAIAGAHIRISKDGVGFGQAISDSNGNYALAGLEAGSYDIYAANTGYQYNVNTAAVTVGSVTTDIDFTLQGNPSTVNGTITDSLTKEPLKGTSIKISEQGSNYYTYTITTSLGEYSLRGLAAGTYTVEALKTGYVNNQTDPFALSTNTNETVIKDLVITTQNPAINNLHSNAFSNWSLLAEDRIHQISWTKSSSTEVVGYRVYRNGVLVKSISANGSLLFESHNNPIGDTVLYSITSVNSDGSQSAATNISLQ